MAHNHAKTLHQVEQELKLAGYSPRTVSSYLGVASRFLRFVDKPARRIGRDDIRRYFVELTERKQAASSINQAHFGVRFLIRDVLKKQWRQPLRLHKRPQRVPIVLSRAEVSTLLSVTESLRYRTIWMALYASGLRASDRVVYRFKDYRDDGQVKTTSLEAVEFLRRFLLHALPVGFQRLRSYGLLANRHRTANLETCRLLLSCAPSPTEPSGEDVAKAEDEEGLWADEVERLTGEDPRRCPVCGEGTLVLLEAVPSRDELNLRSARAPP